MTRKRPTESLEGNDMTEKKIVKVMVETNIPEPLYIRLKDWTAENNLTVEEALALYYPWSA